MKQTMDKEYAALTSLIQNRAAAHPKPKFLVAIAGAPGSGKTTIAAEVVRRLNASFHTSETQSTDESSGGNAVLTGTCPRAALLSMDGFHLPRSVLDALPNREEAYARRGAPFTFDLEGFLEFMHKLRKWADSSSSSSSSQPSSSCQNSTSSDPIYAPSFSHTTKDPVLNGTVIPGNTSILIIEGNYLLLNEPGWKEVSTLVDLRVFISADLVVTRERVAHRHVRAGIEKTLQDAYRRVDGNDTLNGRLIEENIVEGVDLVVHSVDDESCSIST